MGWQKVADTLKDFAVGDGSVDDGKKKSQIDWRVLPAQPVAVQWEAAFWGRRRAFLFFSFFAFPIIFQSLNHQRKSLFRKTGKNTDINNSCTLLRAAAFFMISPAVTYVHFYVIHWHRNRPALHFLKWVIKMAASPSENAILCQDPDSS